MSFETELNTCIRARFALLLICTLEEERARIAHEQAQWKQEFKGMRELLDKQCELLATQLKPGDLPKRPPAAASSAAATARSQELRLRAQARLAAKRSQQQQQGSAKDLMTYGARYSRSHG